jgi:hypothetical protein
VCTRARPPAPAQVPDPGNAEKPGCGLQSNGADGWAPCDGVLATRPAAGTFPRAGRRFPPAQPRSVTTTYATNAMTPTTTVL